jgi:4-amino-4-deoxy-L-arabinose transferase-like glycosyltransferase
MKNIKLTQNPYILFLPFLLIYLTLIVVLHNDIMEGDEDRYYTYAQNLTHGFFSPPPPAINLWSGPGYPIILTPLVALKLPLILLTLINAFFQYLSIIFFFKSLRHFLTHKKALFYSTIWACYYISFQELPSVLTEPFTVFLISALMLCLIKAFNDSSKKYVYLSGFLIGYIALTKIIFGYVILVLLASCFLLWLSKKKSVLFQKSLMISSIAMATTLPYLFYTYHLTDRIFYWGSSGGSSLYWMSNPNEREYGDWNSETFTANCIDRSRSCNADSFKVHHQKDIDSVMKYEGVKRDQMFMKIALNNIKEHPLKYLRNCCSNISRMLFGFPASYFYHRDTTLLRLPPNSIIATLMLFCLIPTLRNWRKINFSIRFLLIFLTLYLGASTIASAYPRHFNVVVPIVLLWIAYTIQNTLTIHWDFKNKEKQNN